MISRARRNDLLILLGLLALPLAVFWPVTIGDRTLLPADNLAAFEPWRSAAAVQGWPQTPHNALLSDLVLENYVWKRFILESLDAGQLPLWNPYLFAGQPFLAAGQNAALYPFSLIFYVVPLWKAYGWFTVSQLFLAGACMYLLARVLGIGRPGAALAAITYELCAFMLVSVVFPMIVAGAAWLPLILACLDRVITPSRAGRAPWLLLGAVGLGCQILAGHVEITYYTLLIAAAFAAWRLVGAYRARRREAASAPGALAQLRAPFVAALALGILGIGLAAAQFVPLLELAPLNFRQDSATYDQVVGWAYPPRHILAFLMPNVFGNPAHHSYVDWWTGRELPATTNARGEPIDTIFWGAKNYVEGGAYLGIVPLLLAVLGLAKAAGSSKPRESAEAFGALRAWMAHPHIPFFAGLALLSLSFAFGLPTYRLIFWLPGIGQLHSPFRWAWPFAVCVAVLAGYGADYLARTRAAAASTASRNPLTLWARPEAATVLAGTAFWGGLALAAAVVAAGGLWDRTGPLVDAALHRLALADGAFADARMFFSYEGRQVLLLGLFLMASGIVLRVSRCAIYLPRWLLGRPVWELLAAVVIALDLIVATGDFNPAADPAILAYRPPVADFLARDPTPWRFTTYTREDQGTTKTFNANTGMYFDWQDVRGYDSMILRQYARFMEQIQPQGELEFNRIAPITRRAALDSPLLDLLGVKYVISELAIDDPKYRLVYDAEVKVYENTRVLPRAFLVPACNIAQESDLAAAAQRLDLSQTLVVDSGELVSAWNCAQPGAGATAAEGAAAVTSYSPIEVWVDATVHTPGPAALVLTDSYFPGWVAFARPQGGTEDQEQEVQVVRVDGNFRAVKLEPGAWTVRFRYSPLSFKLGVFITFMAGVLLAFIGGVWAWRRAYAALETGTTAARVAKNSLAPMAVNLMNRVVDFAFAALMLRILGPANAGEYYFAGTIAAWFEILTNFGLNTYVIREVARDRERAGRYLLNTTLLRWLLWAGVTPLLFLVIGVWSARFALRADTALAIGLLYVALIPSGISAGLTALFYAFEKAEYPAAVTTVTTVLKVTLGALALLYGFGYVGLAAVAIVVNVATMAVLLAVLVRALPPLRIGDVVRARQIAPWQGGVLPESFPLMINHLLATLFFKVDVTLLEPLRGSAVVGWYSTGYKFLEAYNIIPAFFTMAFFPVMSRQAQESPGALQRAYQISVKFLFILALPLAIATVVLAQPLITILGGSQYLPHGAIALQLMVLSIPVGWINSLTQYVLIALGRQRSLTWAFLIAVTFNVTANLIFIPLAPHGYEAAAIITILSEIVEGIPFYIFLRRALAPVPWAALLGRPVAAGLAMTAVAAALAPVSVWLAALAGAVIYGVLLLALGALGPEERAVLRQVLAARRGADASAALAEFQGDQE